MEIGEAIEIVKHSFPFAGYMSPGIEEKSSYANIAGTVVRHVPPSGRILDFGCGPCEKTAIMQLLGFECSGYDDLMDDWHQLQGNREAIAAFARQSNVDLHVADGGAMPFEKCSFDMIMLHDVLEHLHDSPRDLLNDLLELAVSGGLLFITVPNAVNIRKRIAVAFGRTNLPRYEHYYWYAGHFRGHVREYVRDDLIRLVRYLGLDVLELRGCDHMLEKLPQVLRPAYLLVTRFFPGWKDTWLLVARKPAGWTPRRIPPEGLMPKLPWPNFQASTGCETNPPAGGHNDSGA